MKRNPWDPWVCLTLGSFAVLEGLALGYRWFPPLSHRLAEIAGTNPRKRRGSFVPGLFLAFWAWLTLHIIRWGGLPEKEV